MSDCDWWIVNSRVKVGLTLVSKIPVLDQSKVVNMVLLVHSLMNFLTMSHSSMIQSAPYDTYIRHRKVRCWDRKLMPEKCTHTIHLSCD